MMKTMEFTAEQQHALWCIEDWYRNGREQVFRLSGYAGTGKTTIAREIPALLGLERVQYAAFTGKAASVLRSKGCEGATTLHSLLYRSSESEVRDEWGKPVWIVPPETIRNEAGEIVEEKPGLPMMRMTFEPRDPDEGEKPLSEIDLFIVDEMSMLAQIVVDDLLCVGVRVLVLGDPGQLPPIRGSENTLTSVKPDVLLRNVQRNQGAVLDLATRVRERGAHAVEPFEHKSMSIDDMLDFDQVLVWKNMTRWKMIRQMRMRLGRLPGIPVVGDSVMFLSNRPALGRFNGQQGKVQFVAEHGDTLTLVLDDGLGPVDVPLIGFKSRLGQEEAEARYRRSENLIPATFSQAVTVHKAQGSEWDRVCVLNETMGMNDDLLAQRWLYTGITRAVKDVSVVAQGGW